MQIRFAPRRGTLEMEISGIVGGGPLSRWFAGEVREIPDDQVIAFSGYDGVTRQIKAVDAIFSCGPDFTDAKTTRNPLYACADCGAVPEAESFLNRFNGTMVCYNVDSDPAKDRLCTACYLARYPQFVVTHRSDGCPEEILAAAQERSAKVSKVPSSPTLASPVAAPVAATAPSRFERAKDVRPETTEEK